VNTAQNQSVPVVRPITDADVPTSVDTLARAFADYPFTRHVVAADGHEERVRRFEEFYLTRIGMVYGRVWVADEGRAVAVWTTPEQDPSPAFAELGQVLGELTGDRQAAYEAAEEAVAPYRPQEPVWFLYTLGVAPEAQGRGLGGAVLVPGIEEARRTGYPAFLETSREANVRFYERLGFRVTAAVSLPDDGPRAWCMRRDPR
jgi:ribosomal protein S18 acetylase RimI-like enzyme